jgi:hypothetical protein
MPTIASNRAGAFTSYPSSLSGPIPGDRATGHIQRLVVDWVDNLAPQDTPLLNKIKKGKAYDQNKIEWGSSGNLLHTAEVDNNPLADNGTTLNVASGQGVRFQVYQLLALYNLDDNDQPDFTTKEIVWVTAITNDALTIVRAQGGTTATAFAQGAKVEILGTAVPEADDFTKSPTVFGDFYSNYFQTIQVGHNITEVANATPNFEFESSNHIARLMRDAGKRAKLLLEKEIVQGGPQEGTNASGAVRPSTMAGFPYYIPSANKFNCEGQKINPYDIETMGAQLWDTVGDEGAKTLLMSMRTARMFDPMLDNMKQLDGNTTTFRSEFTKFQTRVGTWDIMHTRWVPEGVIFGVNTNRLSIHPFKGMEWTEKEHSTDGAYLWRSIYGRYTLVCTAPETMFQIYGFDTDLGNYDRVF